MNKIFGFFLVFLIFTHCSLDTKSGFWTKSQTIKKEENVKEKKVTELFKEPKTLEKEYNSKVKIRLNTKSKNKKNSKISEKCASDDSNDLLSSLKLFFKNTSPDTLYQDVFF